MKNLLFLVLALLFTASAPALQPDTPLDIQMAAISDGAPVYVDLGLTDPAMSPDMHQNTITSAAVDPGDPCPAVGALAADHGADRDNLSTIPGAKRMPIANALYASLSVNLKDKVPK